MVERRNRGTAVAALSGTGARPTKVAGVDPSLLRMDRSSAGVRRGIGLVLFVPVVGHDGCKSYERPSQASQQILKIR
jgi:hypothetical protein